MAMVRLNKYLASCGVASRRACEKLISSGRVTVNGQIITSLGTRVDEKHDAVAVDGKQVRPALQRVYIMLNKPSGYVTTVRDTRGRPKVMDLVPAALRLFPVGRLDIDTEGLLLLTNDGELTHRLLHPRFKVAKKYRALLDREVGSEDLAKLKKGVALADGMSAPCQVHVTPEFPPGRVMELVLYEGRKRQVRRMFAALGYRVLMLRRLGFGPLALGDLPTGSWRELTAQEVAQLHMACAPQCDGAEERTTDCHARCEG